MAHLIGHNMSVGVIGGDSVGANGEHPLVPGGQRGIEREREGGRRGIRGGREKGKEPGAAKVY